MDVPTMWQRRGRIGGSRPSLNPANANKPIDSPEGLGDSPQFGSLPDFYRGGDRRGVFRCVAGPIPRMGPDEHREKHWTVS